jgi:nitroimidazol reductase NimA-like FMN-containing flavoprotein (pyridoxamine 5'-phosphate oxidase superfamily)
MLGKLTIDQMNSLITSQALGRLACTDGLHPYIVPVTYTYNGKFIYGQTNEGKKLDVLRKNPNVCFQVERMSNMRNWESVLVYGQFEELKDPEEIEMATNTLHDRFFHLVTSGTTHGFNKGESVEVEDTNRLKQVLYKIKIERMTGRFEKA